MRSIYRRMVLAEELALWFGEVSQDHQRIAGSSAGCAVTRRSLRSTAILSQSTAPARMQAL